MKNFIYLAQVLPLGILLFVFKILPLDAASALGGWLGEHLGFRLAASRKAYKNLDLAFPDMDAERKDQIVRGMWRNIGRTAAEYMHLAQIGRDRVTIVHEEIFTDVVRQKAGGIFISAHMANWEINAPMLYARYDMLLHLTYRAPNNPYAGRLLDRVRSLNGKIPGSPKHRASGREIMNALKQKQFIGILIDQKYNEGVAVPFFGVPAMTNPIFVKLAQKYNCPVVPVRNQRLRGAYFESIVHPPLPLFDENGAALPAETVIAEAHALLERWIRENPEQWLWLHRRWPQDAAREPS